MNITRPDESDLPGILAIYNHEVTHGTASFDITPRTVQDFLPWFRAHNVANHPLLVAKEGDGSSLFDVELTDVSQY